MKGEIVSQPQEDRPIRSNDGKHSDGESKQARGLEHWYCQQDLIRAVIAIREPRQKASKKKQSEDGDCAVQLRCPFTERITPALQPSQFHQPQSKAQTQNSNDRKRWLAEHKREQNVQQQQHGEHKQGQDTERRLLLP